MAFNICITHRTRWRGSLKGKGTLCDAYLTGHAYNYGQSVESLSNLTSLPGDEQNSFSKVIVNSPPTKMVPLVQTCLLPLLTCLTNEYNGISADNTLQLEPVFERKGNNNNKNNAM